MIRVKLPFGEVTSTQLHRIFDVSDEYSRGRLHITTRQDIQIHHVSLDRTPELWVELEKTYITLREACGNVVRNVTATETAGVDVNEPFDVSPYADVVFKFFLWNPTCQEMGRKFKISFLGTDEDTGLSYLHDLGFIAKIENGKRGFKVMLGGGLGSQPRHTVTLFEFLESDKIIPVTESVLRVFDRYGERSKRVKARLKFLIEEIGLDAFVDLIEKEQLAVSLQKVAIDTSEFDIPISVPNVDIPFVEVNDKTSYENWKKSNVIRQSQDGFYAIGIKVLLGDFYLGGIVTKGNVKITISTNGKSPTMAKRLRQFFEEVIPENVDDLVLNLNRYRKSIKGNFTDKVSRLNKLTEGFVEKTD